MGNLEKVVLVFDEAWWNPDGPASVISANEDGAWPWFADTSQTAKAPVLTAFTGGSFSRSRSDLTDEEVVADALSMAEAAYGREVPLPVATAVTRWATDPYAMGSYLILPPGASPEDVDALAAPVGDRLLFAGEATNWDYAATVHGALLSGLREARRLGVERNAIPGLEDWQVDLVP